MSDLEDNEYEEVNGLSRHPLPNRWDGEDVEVRRLDDDILSWAIDSTHHLDYSHPGNLPTSRQV